MIRAGIYGASGYTGHELIRILANHPAAEIAFATSKTYAGQPLSNLYPTAPEIVLTYPDEANFDEVDVTFLCLPHATAAKTAVVALANGKRVIDLSADFRLRDPDTYAKWYGHTHPAQELLKTAVYGLTEFARPELPGASLVGNPGCYPTSILLALQPLLDSDITLVGPIVADSKSGVSGAGRAPKPATHFVQVADNFSPYNIGRSHRHLPEMEQVMHWWRPAAPSLVFSPHLLPVPRGILSTIYVGLGEEVEESTIRQLYETAYNNEPFVRVLGAGQLPSLAHVVGTNRCVIGIVQAGPVLILTSAIDNLLKGAAGQAVQNMNVMFGLEETAGLAGGAAA